MAHFDLERTPSQQFRDFLNPRERITTNALDHREIFWRDHQEWLQEKGYMLRPRYHPDWVSSAGDMFDPLYEFEDSVRIRVSNLNTEIRLHLKV